MTQDSDTAEGRGEVWVLIQMILLFAIAVVPFLIGSSWGESLTGVSVVLGLFSGLIGLAFVALSAQSLGSNLSVFPRPKTDSTLTQQGVYGLVRHPMYTGVVLTALGWSLIRTSWLAIVLTGVLLIFFDRKAAKEEIWLSERFSGYQDYKQHVRKLIPWIY